MNSENEKSAQFLHQHWLTSPQRQLHERMREFREELEKQGIPQTQCIVSTMVNPETQKPFWRVTYEFDVDGHPASHSMLFSMQLLNEMPLNLLAYHIADLLKGQCENYRWDSRKQKVVKK